MPKPHTWAPLAFFLLLVSAASPQSVTTDLSNGATFTFEIEKNLPSFIFEIDPDKRETDDYGNAQSTISDIDVFRGNSRTPLQHLEGCDFDSMQPPPRGNYWFHTDDYNFDGYQDIFLMTWWGATGNFGGCIWLFNPKTGLFEYSKEFSDLDIRDVDPSTKTVSSIGNSSAADWHTERYAVKNNHPVLLWSEAQSFNDASGKDHCKIDERRNGKMVTVLDVDTECPANVPSP